jgi:hypothetical protein
MLTEIHLRHACSCQEILRMELRVGMARHAQAASRLGHRPRRRDGVPAPHQGGGEGGARRRAGRDGLPMPSVFIITIRTRDPMRECSGSVGGSQSAPMLVSLILCG